MRYKRDNTTWARKMAYRRLADARERASVLSSMTGSTSSAVENGRQQLAELQQEMQDIRDQVERVRGLTTGYAAETGEAVVNALQERVASLERVNRELMKLLGVTANAKPQRPPRSFVIRHGDGTEDTVIEGAVANAVDDDILDTPKGIGS